MDFRTPESFLIHTMNSGFEKAASAFSKLIHRPVTIVSSQSIVQAAGNTFSYLPEERGELYVLITQLIGDVSGRSFLILNEEESKEIFKAIHITSGNPKLNEAFLLEIDNIISASVIAELSNQLKLEIYGDVPQLIKINAPDLHEFLRYETSTEDAASVIFSNTTFKFDGKEKIHPQFIWRLSNKIFELISVQTSIGV